MEIKVYGKKDKKPKKELKIKKDKKEKPMELDDPSRWKVDTESKGSLELAPMPIPSMSDYDELEKVKTKATKTTKKPKKNRKPNSAITPTEKKNLKIKRGY